jgi:hypothetical protein
MRARPRGLWFVIATTSLAGGLAAAQDARDAATAPEPPLAWLGHRWTADAGRGSFLWAEASRPRWADRASAPEWKEKWRAELTFEGTEHELRGTLDATRIADGEKHTAVTFVISCAPDACSLDWREGGARYTFDLADSNEKSRLHVGTLEWARVNRYLRFDRPRTRSRRSPYPAIIELRLDGGKLHLTRYAGPQHGAMVPMEHVFAPAP